MENNKKIASVLKSLNFRNAFSIYLLGYNTETTGKQSHSIANWDFGSNSTLSWYAGLDHICITRTPFFF